MPIFLLANKFKFELLLGNISLTIADDDSNSGLLQVMDYQKVEVCIVQGFQVEQSP